MHFGNATAVLSWQLIPCFEYLWQAWGESPAEDSILTRILFVAVYLRIQADYIFHHFGFHFTWRRTQSRDCLFYGTHLYCHEAGDCELHSYGRCTHWGADCIYKPYWGGLSSLLLSLPSSAVKLILIFARIFSCWMKRKLLIHFKSSLLSSLRILNMRKGKLLWIHPLWWTK